jgi:hypothetical protein
MMVEGLPMRLILSLALAGLAAPALAQEPAAAAPPEVRTCLAIAAIRGTAVVNSRTIDFTLRDGSVWRSNLPNACPQLGTERAFSYETAQSQLCAQDMITVVVPVAGSLTGARCGLGPFEKLPPRQKR